MCVFLYVFVYVFYHQGIYRGDFVQTPRQRGEFGSRLEKNIVLEEFQPIGAFNSKYIRIIQSKKNHL